MIKQKANWLTTLIILILCIFTFTNTTLAKEYASPQQKQNLMKITNDFVLEGKKNGLIKKIDKMCEGKDCIFTFWVNENLYNQYGYEDRQGIKRLIMEYGQLRGEGAITRGYYSGKHL